jgi:hypothetical protein
MKYIIQSLVAVFFLLTSADLLHARGIHIYTNDEVFIGTSSFDPTNPGIDSAKYKSLMQLVENIIQYQEIVTSVTADNQQVSVINRDGSISTMEKKWVRESDGMKVTRKGSTKCLAILKAIDRYIRAIYRTGNNEISISFIDSGIESTTVLTRNDDNSMNFIIDYFKNDADSFIFYTIGDGVRDGKKVTVRGRYDAQGNLDGPFTYEGPGTMELFKVLYTTNDSITIRNIFKGTNGVIKEADFKKAVKIKDTATSAITFKFTDLSTVIAPTGLILTETQIEKSNAKLKKKQTKTVIKYIQQPDGIFTINKEVILPKK